MSFKIWIPILVLAVVAALAVILPCVGGEVPLTSGYKVLSPIRHGNLTVFPVAAASSHNTQSFLTLDEGLRSGEVIVTEAGNVQPLMRRRPRPVKPPAPKPFEDQEDPDDTRHELDELA